MGTCTNLRLSLHKTPLRRLYKKPARRNGLIELLTGQLNVGKDR